MEDGHYDARYCSVGIAKWVPWFSTITKTLVIYDDRSDRGRGTVPEVCDWPDRPAYRHTFPRVVMSSLAS